jgi:hypothetical protein
MSTLKSIINFLIPITCLGGLFGLFLSFGYLLSLREDLARDSFAISCFYSVLVIFLTWYKNQL